MMLSFVCHASSHVPILCDLRSLVLTILCDFLKNEENPGESEVFTWL